MKPSIRVAVVALVISPIAALAQTNGPVTRAQVRAELMQLEKRRLQPLGEGPVLSARYPGRGRRACRRTTAARRAYGAVGGRDPRCRPARPHEHQRVTLRSPLPQHEDEPRLPASCD